MKIDTVYAVSATAASTVSTTVAGTGPTVWNLGGIPVPVVPAFIGVLAALLVRVIVITSPTRRNRELYAYNIAITLLTMLGAGVWITDHQLGPGASFWTGVGCGALGVSMVELARSQLFTALQTGLRSMFSALTAVAPPKGPDQSEGS